MFLVAGIFGGFSCVRFAGYLELRGVPPNTRGTPICMGYLYLCGTPLIVQGTSTYTGYLKSYRAPRIMQGTFDCAEIILLVDTWHFYYLSYFSLKQHPPSFFLARSIGSKRNSLYV